MTITAVFEGNTASDLVKAQSWASNAIGGVTIFTGQASWQDYTGSVGWEQGLWSGFSGTKLWSIPLFANGSDLHSAGAGAYDGYYKTVAQTLASGQASGPIYVRTGWEFNGGWEAWSAQGKADDYVAAFHQFVDTFRTVSDRFVFTWAPNIGDQGMDPSTAYPGDSYVDIVGQDFYWNPAYQGSDPNAAFASMVNQTYGLQWLESFAAAHGKPTAYPEWGVESANGAPFVKAAAAWFASHDVAYQGYWDSDADFAGKLSDGSLPDVGAAYLAAFAGDSGGAIAVKALALSAAAPILGSARGDIISLADGQGLAFGLDGDDKIFAAPGGSMAFGNQGADTLIGAAGADSLWGGQGNDYLDGGGGHDLLFGNLGDDRLIAGDGGSSLWGGQGNDVLIGGAGEDLLSGDRGNDTLTGGGGHDVFVLAPGGGHDVITDFATASDRNDLTAFGASAPTISDTAQGALVTESTGESFLLQDVSASHLSFSSGWVVGA